MQFKSGNQRRCNSGCTSKNHHEYVQERLSLEQIADVAEKCVEEIKAVIEKREPVLT